MLVLGIESSCDDTSAALVRDGREILSNIVSSQTDIHRRFGGVVPELAAREHIQNVLPVIQAALREARIDSDGFDGIGVTIRPGLIGSLVVGLAAAKSLAYALQRPIVGLNHIEAHCYANCFGGLPYDEPHITLCVSGGHTLLLENRGPKGSRILGGTVDDAAGEAFDKVAKLMGLGFPGGPAVQAAAAGGDPHAVPLPRPMQDSHDLRLSFSGLKTAVRYYAETHPDYRAEDLAASFQQAVIDILTAKTQRALRQTGLRACGLAGGVAANRLLRQSLSEMCAREGAAFHAPPLILCTDNAAMVAGLAYHKLSSGLRHGLDLNASPSGGI